MLRALSACILGAYVRYIPGTWRGLFEPSTRGCYEHLAKGDFMENDLMKQREQLLLELIHDKAYVPMKAKEIAALLNIPRSQREELKEVLDALVEEGKIGLCKRGKYGKPEQFAVQGIFSGNSRGFGFVTVEGMERDVFIPEEKKGQALNGDKVRIVITQPESGEKRAEGEVIRVLEHANSQVIGYYQKNKTFGFVIPDNPRIDTDVFIPQGKDMGAVTGHKVVVRIVDFGDGKRNPEGEVTEILGHVNDPGTDILSIVKAYGLPEEFPQEVMEQIASIPDRVYVPEETAPLSYEGDYGLDDLRTHEEWDGDLAGRLDLRSLPTVTIDGEDAKDLDDAITISKRKDGTFILGVHIADVSHYVPEGTWLDEEALKRGTSIYLVDRVIPMLPHKLSNGICSLNEGVDRLALSCIMEVDARGNVTDHRICETLVRVDRRMTYTAVNAIVEGQEGPEREEYRDLAETFMEMKELSLILREKRRSRGAVDFDFPESKIILDSQGKPLEIRPYERNTATRIIEDFMLLANETVAEDYYWQSVPFLYRSHDNPDPEKMKQLAAFINNFGYAVRISQGEIHPKEVQKLLDRIQGKEEEALLARLTLRSMKQAKYTTECSGHFGLATRYYTHFTSPIRRYPDLQIHRIIKECLRGGLKERRAVHYAGILPEVAVKTSALERRADEAERETEKLKKCQYMEQFTGHTFDGVISGVTGWGFFVELPNTVEGLVRLSDLEGDYYVFDEKRYQLKGERTGKTYKLGQRIKVTVAGTDRITRTVEFALYENHGL